MCLGIPGEIVSTGDQTSLLRTGVVRFGGITKDINLAYVPDAKVGDYVIVHVGFAISKIDEQEAHRIFDYLEQIDELAELETTES